MQPAYGRVPTCRRENRVKLNQGEERVRPAHSRRIMAAKEPWVRIGLAHGCMHYDGKTWSRSDMQSRTQGRAAVCRSRPFFDDWVPSKPSKMVPFKSALTQRLLAPTAYRQQFGDVRSRLTLARMRAAYITPGLIQLDLGNKSSSQPSAVHVARNPESAGSALPISVRRRTVLGGTTQPGLTSRSRSSASPRSELPLDPGFTPNRSAEKSSPEPLGVVEILVARRQPQTDCHCNCKSAKGNCVFCDGVSDAGGSILKKPSRSSNPRTSIRPPSGRDAETLEINLEGRVKRCLSCLSPTGYLTSGASSWLSHPYEY